MFEPSSSSIGSATVAATSSMASTAPSSSRASPYSLNPYYAAQHQGYPQSDHYHGMYHPAGAMEAWHHAYPPLGHLYRGYEAAATMEWPPPPPPPPPPHQHHHSSELVDPLGDLPSYSAASTSPAATSNGGTESPRGQVEYKLFSGRGGESSLRHKPADSGVVTHSSPDSGLAASDGISASGSPNNGLPMMTAAMAAAAGSLERPQPARSPYEWMKRPAAFAADAAARPAASAAECGGGGGGSGGASSGGVRCSSSVKEGMDTGFSKYFPKVTNFFLGHYISIR